MRLRLLFSILFLALVSRAQVNLGLFPEFRPVVLESAKPQTLASVPLPPDAFTSLNSGLNNLVFVDANAYAVPHLLRPASETRDVSKRVNHPSEVNQLTINDGNQITILVDRRPPFTQPVNGLVIETSLQNFENRLSVFSRPSTNATWELLTDNAVIFDYSRFMAVRDTTVTFPATNHPHFRIVVADAVDQTLANRFEKLSRSANDEDQSFDQTRRTVELRPLHLKSVALFQTITQRVPGQTRLRDYPPQSVSRTTDPDNGDSRFLLTMAAEPVTQLEFVTDARNFTRRVVVEKVETSEIGQRWHRLADTRIYRIGTAPNDKQNLIVEFPQTRTTQLRVTIENGDQAPLNVTELKAGGPLYEALLIVPEPPDLTCYLGGDAPRPAYDAAPIEQLLRDGRAPIAVSLGPPAPNPLATGGGPSLFSHPATFIAAVLLAIAALAWALFRAGRKLNHDAESPK